ncbi:MAG: ABC transporter permease [Phycisphaeraceae bacterium]
MKKILGIFGLLFVVCLITAIFSDRFLTSGNIENLLRRTALFGTISIGAAFVIITSGIDLSIGSLIGVVGVLLPWLMRQHGWSVPASLGMVMLVSLTVGLGHGLLITKLRLQPFIVTLCGLMFYRGLARFIAGDNSQGFGTDYEGLKSLATFPTVFIIMAIIAAIAIIFLNFTIYGRYLMALGRNEQAARFSGINTDRMIIVAYVLCSLLAGVGGVLFALDTSSIQPSNFGSFYELYAIAAAVLGGCSLRGGEGSIIGVIIGAAVMVVLNNSIILLRIPSELEYCIIGAVILAGAIVDELVKRIAASRRAAKQARAAME